MKTLTALASIASFIAVSLFCTAGEVDLNPVPPPAPPGAGAAVPAGDAAAPEGGAPAEKDEGTVRVFLDSDVIYLRDGTQVHGTIIVVARKGALILTEEGEQLVPRENIEKMDRARDKERSVKLPIRSEDGLKFIVMEPIEDEDAAAGEEGAAPEQNAPKPKEGVEPPKAPAAKAVAPKAERPLKEVPLGDDEMKKLKEASGRIADLMKKAEADPELKKKIEEMKKRMEEAQKKGPLPAKKW